MIAMQNIIDKDKSLLTILFDKKVMDYMKCKLNDYVFFIQSNFNPYYFFMIKSDTGYRIKSYPCKSKIWQINISHRFNYLEEFDITECSYFLRKHNSIRIIKGK